MGIKLDASLSQWIDLGSPKGVCLAQPDICRANGGSVGLWVKLEAGGKLPGIISSKRTETARGFQLGYNNVGLV